MSSWFTFGVQYLYYCIHFEFIWLIKLITLSFANYSFKLYSLYLPFVAYHKLTTVLSSVNFARPYHRANETYCTRYVLVVQNSL